MTRLSHKDYDLVLDVIRETSAHTEIASLPQKIVTLLARAVPCDISAYNEVDHRSGELRATHNYDPGAAQYFPAFQAYAHEHPLLNHVVNTGDLTAHKLTDFVSVRAFKRTALYNEFYRHFGIPHNLARWLISSPECHVATSIFRGGSDFGERDRAIMNHLGPHFSQALQNARRLAVISEKMDVLDATVRDLNRGIILLSKSGRIAWMTELAQQWLARYFPDDGLKRNQLPPAVQLWINRSLARTGEKLISQSDLPFVVNRAARRLTIYQLRETDGSARLILSENRLAGCPDDFLPLGLTARECQVLHWIAEGKSNSEIGVILGRSANTIRKHVEHILAKMGVDNRASAIRLALDHLMNFHPFKHQ